MAEAPNILLFLLLTSVLDSVTSCLIFCEIWTMATMMLWVRHKWQVIATQALKSDKSARKTGRQRRTSFTDHLRFHCFKQRIKYKHKHKGRYRKPKKLFHLTWKFKALKLTLQVAVSIYQAGCRVERLVGHSFQLLLCLRLSLCQLLHQLIINCRIKSYTTHQAFKSTLSALSHPF